MIAATERAGTLGLPGDLLRLPFTGNGTFDGASAATIDLTPLDMRLLHYRAFSAGVQRTVGDRLGVAAHIERCRVSPFGHRRKPVGAVADATGWSWTVQGSGRRRRWPECYLPSASCRSA